MRTLLLSAFLFLNTYAQAQLIITHKVVDDFNAMLQKSHAKPELIDQINGFGYGVMMIMIDKTDILNKKDIEYFGNAHVEPYVLDTDKTIGKVIERKIIPVIEDITNQPMPYGGVRMQGNGILLNASITEPFETHTIENGKLINLYEEYAKYDTIFRLKLTDKKTNALKIPLKKMTLKLSSSNFKAGTIIYGEVYFVTEPFYADNSRFKSGYIIKRVRRKYIFRAPIRPEQ